MIRMPLAVTLITRSDKDNIESEVDHNKSDMDDTSSNRIIPEVIRIILNVMWMGLKMIRMIIRVTWLMPNVT